MKWLRARAASPQTEGPVARDRKRYRAPAFSQLSPDEARKALLERAGDSDPAAQQMLDRFEVPSREPSREIT